ncbi:hypothetical protein FRC0069_01029 [Corynebacterium diphtheriae]|nr:hypothetical protein CIP101352_01143 [Corynebacterium diphtheriae]CAB0643463.1 hypothetical protein CIP107561_00960 [Corynebacterium diphtheriae]CAB0645850.1 hypothetical protein CIP107567_01086 [Corynebacterium diphtheriae]CAB0692582.1 hypothetical protein FRC0069_01029 [Corynebacterium diphtheriae]CAB0729930.1 hypothetical protein FRC0095_01074 [Corynebacterium diphtheriae]
MEGKDESHGGKCRLPAFITAGQIGLRKPPLRLVISILLVQGVLVFPLSLIQQTGSHRSVPS